MNFKEVTHRVIDIVKETAYFLRAEAEKISSPDIEEKGLHDLVTYVDKEAENRLVDVLSILIPEAGFIAEENKTLKTKEIYNWIIDPLDGTTNYIHGIPVYSISIALTKNEEIVLGVVYEVCREECFYTWKDAPSYLNGKIISVSKTESMDKSLVATGFPYHDYSLMDSYLSLFNELMRNSRGIRRLGSAAVDLAYIACGRFEVFYEYGLHPWDVAAGALIVKNAGGKVSDFTGANDFIENSQIIASNSIIHPEFLKTLQSHFKVN